MDRFSSIFNQLLQLFLGLEQGSVKFDSRPRLIRLANSTTTRVELERWSDSTGIDRLGAVCSHAFLSMYDRKRFRANQDTP